MVSYRNNWQRQNRSIVAFFRTQCIGAGVRREGGENAVATSTSLISRSCWTQPARRRCRRRRRCAVALIVLRCSALSPSLSLSLSLPARLTSILPHPHRQLQQPLIHSRILSPHLTPPLSPTHTLILCETPASSATFSPLRARPYNVFASVRLFVCPSAPHIHAIEELLV